MFFVIVFKHLKKPNSSLRFFFWYLDYLDRNGEWNTLMFTVLMPGGNRLSEFWSSATPLTKLMVIN